VWESSARTSNALELVQRLGCSIKCCHCKHGMCNGLSRCLKIDLASKSSVTKNVASRTRPIAECGDCKHAGCCWQSWQQWLMS
jgi:hypothetical protein